MPREYYFQRAASEEAQVTWLLQKGEEAERRGEPGKAAIVLRWALSHDAWRKEYLRQVQE
jgi:hypothetical protein